MEMTTGDLAAAGLMQQQQQPAGATAGAMANLPPNLSNQERYLPLSMVLEHAIQKAYHDLTIMIDMFPATSDRDKKIKIVEFAFKTRQLFLRIYALVEFIKTAHINVSNILSFLDQQSFIFIDTADFLYDLAKNKLVNARLPSFSISTSVDVITLGTYPRLPLCIKGRIISDEGISAGKIQETVAYLNQIIQCRLALSDIPNQFKNFKIKKGYVVFWVPNEFLLKLTVTGDSFKLPWKLLELKFLIKDHQSPNQKLIHNMQVKFMSNVIQGHLDNNDRPLLNVYKSLHFFALSLQLEILFQQVITLNRITLGRFYKIEYANWKKLTIKYWIEYSKNQYDFKLSIGCDENCEFLQSTHSPVLTWQEHQNIDSLFKREELLIEKLIHETVILRTVQRLKEIHTVLTQHKFCKSVFNESKPDIRIKFFENEPDNETLWISIDFYSGLFQVFLPDEFPANHKTAIEAALNNDIQRLKTALLSLRSWLVIRKCKTLGSYYGFKCSHDLSITSFLSASLEAYYTKSNRNNLFIQIKSLEGTMVRVALHDRSSEAGEFVDEQRTCRLGYYLIKVAKCKYDGELDPTKPYLKLMSISELKHNSLLQTGSSKAAIKGPSAEHAMMESDLMIWEFINVLTHIEERLPLLSFIQILNKKNIVTQSIQVCPESMFMTNLNLLSMPVIHSSDLMIAADPYSSQGVNMNKFFKSTNAELWSLMNSCCIRQKNFKDYLTLTLPLMIHPKFIPPGMLSQFTFLLEFTYEKELLNLLGSTTTTTTPTPGKQLDIYSVVIDAKNLDSFYELIKLEWQSIGQIYKLIKELKLAFQSHPELRKQIRVKRISFKRIIISYGTNFAYNVLIQWSRDAKQYDIILGTNSVKYARSKVDAPLINYQNLFFKEIKKYFLKNQSIIGLVQTLNSTCTCTYALAKLCNLPKFYLRLTPQPAPNYVLMNGTISLMAGFSLLICSLTHIKLIYYSKYCLDIHFKSNGLVSIRDGSFFVTDVSATEEFHPIQFLWSFLNKFMDENVEEILRRRSSLVGDDNPSSPTSAQVAGSHQFLPPTSPAVQPRLGSSSSSSAAAANAAAPSPVRDAGNYFAPSPGGIGAPASNPPALAAQSPSNSFSNFGSPAVLHNSPQQHAPVPSAGAASNQPNLTSQSPGSFMSPAGGTHQQSFSLQSPADYSLQSPLQNSQYATKSPYPAVNSNSANGPSFGNVPSNESSSNTQGSSYQGGPPQSKKINTGQAYAGQAKSGDESFNLSAQLTMINHFHHKKYHSAALPIFLSANGFIRILTPTAESVFCPLETFLASNHLKKILTRHIQHDPSFQDNGDLSSIKTQNVEFQIQNEITPSYVAFTVNFLQLFNYDPTQTELLGRYLYSKVLVPPFKSSAAISFFNLVAVQEPKFFREMMQLLDYETNQMHWRYNWRVKFCWSVPTCLQVKTAKANFGAFFNGCLLSFVKRDKYYFILNLINNQRGINVNSQIPCLGSIYVLFSYDPASNVIQHEMMRSLNEQLQLFNFYENQLNTVIANSTTRQLREPTGVSIVNIVADLLNSLPSYIQAPPGR